MKICITSKGDTIDSEIDPRFGRCMYFIVYDVDTGESKAFDNENRDGSGGVGIKSAEFMASQGVRAVLTGNVGPNAFETLKSAGIKIYTGMSGKVKDAVSSFKAGNLNYTSGPTVNTKQNKQTR